MQAAGGDSSWHYYSSTESGIRKAEKDINAIARRPHGEFIIYDNTCYKYDTIILIGYSYGGDAADKVAQWLARNQIRVDLVVTIDPVAKNAGGLGKGPNVSKWANLFQTVDPFISGQQVAGAVEDQLPPEAFAGLLLSPHVAIPTLPKVVNQVTAEIQNVPELRDSYRFKVF